MKPEFDEKQLLLHIGALATEEAAPALSALCAAAKGKAAQAYIKAHIERDKLYDVLLRGSQKARKNAARLLGALSCACDEDILLEALAKEDTLLVRPSMILALGSVGGEKARAHLAALPEPQAADDAGLKHVREEKEALRLALAKLSPVEKHVFTGFPAPRSATLCAPAGFAPALLEELQALGIGAKPGETGGEAACAARDPRAYFGARCFTELLFPLADGVACDAQAAAEAAKTPFIRLLTECHEGKPPFRYRVEYKGDAKFIAAFVAAMDCEQLINSPSHYEAELRLVVKDNGRLRILCKLFTLEDIRFSYRKQALPASIHPALAACLARLGLSFAPGAKRVLDPCCGSGTLLIEYAKLIPEASCTGVDVSPAALDIARVNTAAAQIRCGFVQRDLSIFHAHDLYDIVLANLPFGNRVGSHVNNERLYAALCARLPLWLKKGGVAILYTMEFTLLKKCLAQHKDRLLLVREKRTEAGGLLPTVFVVKVL